MFCAKCGKENGDGAMFCSSCGAALQQLETTMSEGRTDNSEQPKVKKVPTNTLCIVGLVVSVISLFLNFWGLTGIAGVIVSVAGLSSCKRRMENGKGIAVTGIVIGALSILYGCIVLLAMM